MNKSTVRDNKSFFPLPKPVLWRLFIPISTLIVLMIASASTVFFLQHKTRLNDQLELMSERFEDAYHAEVNDLAESLELALIPIASNYHLKQQLVLGEKEKLLYYWRPIFEKLNKDFGINHFTFMDKYRNRILRIHLPEQSDGIVNRHTILEAERTGNTAWGIEMEMGSLEIPTLRVVKPVFKESEIVGYVELGEDIDKLLREIHERTNIHLIATVFKENIDRQRWEKTMKTLGREAEWDKLNDAAIFYSTFIEIPTGLTNILNGRELKAISKGQRINFNNKIWQVSEISILDAAGNEIGRLTFMVDSTSIVKSFRELTIIGGLIILILLVTLLSLMFYMLKRTDKFIALQYKALTESETNYKELFNNVSDSIVIYDLDGNFKDCNENAFKLYGYSQSELRDIKPQDIVHPEYYSILLENQQRIRNGETTLVESVHLRKDGTNFPVEIKSSMIVMGDKPVVISVIRDISERKKQDELIKKQSDWMDALLRTPTEGLWIVDSSKRLVLVNDAYVRMSGYSKDELLNTSISQLEALETPNEIAKRIKSIIQKGWGVFESKHRQKDGTIYDVLVSVSYDSQKDEFYGYIRDITEDNKIKSDLEIALLKYKTLFNSFPLGITIADENGKITESNTKAEELLGISQNEQLRRRIVGEEWNIIRRDGSQMDPNEYPSVRALKENRTVENVEMGIVKGNNGITWINVTATPIELDKSKVIIAYGDISDKVELQMDLLLKENAIQNSHTGIAISGTDGALSYVNNAFKQLWGYETNQEVLGRSVFEFWQNPADIIEITESMKASSSWTGERVAKRKDGSTFQCQISANFLNDASGKITHFMGSFWDCTHRKEYELEITNALREKEFLIQEIHHRVKNNLQIVSSLIYLQSLQIKDREIADIFTQNLNRIRSMALVHDFLYQSENLKSFDFKGYIEQLISNANSGFKGENQQINYEIDSNEIIPFEQAIYIGLLVLELLTNAVKYAFVGKSEGIIRIRMERMNGNFILTFSDNGIGIPNVETILESNSFGVLVIKTLAKQLNGIISYRSENGTQVTLIFPQS